MVFGDGIDFAQKDIDAWLGLVMEHAHPTGNSSQQSNESTTPADRACCVLARGLEANPKSAVLWVVYLHLIKQLFPSKLSQLGDHAVKTQPHSYALWHWLVHAYSAPFDGAEREKPSGVLAVLTVSAP